MEGPVLCRGPDEIPTFNPFCIEGHSNPVMPDQFHQIAASAPKDKNITSIGISPQKLLNPQRQTGHAKAHVCRTCRQPYLQTRGKRDHERKT